ncbi:hypothetical protein C900_02084 [Fulvivirga imtechensis AK7]|uniref:Uncharacterized protein n=1 Tax=Fulvivirga imtechensis AK7 TaxID=1237149 RepID=L8JY31_9BACT|nr:hypothetical protein C900_02084 [Fulvivirga imtechensis AK7]
MWKKQDNYNYSQAFSYSIFRGSPVEGKLFWKYLYHLKNKYYEKAINPPDDFILKLYLF